MTKEQFKTIEKHKDMILSAAKTMTLVAADPNAIEELHKVYVELGYRDINVRCNECRMGMLLTFNRLYIENKDYFNKPIKNGTKESKTGGRGLKEKGNGTKK